MGNPSQDKTNADCCGMVPNIRLREILSKPLLDSIHQHAATYFGASHTEHDISSWYVLDTVHFTWSPLAPAVKLLSTMLQRALTALQGGLLRLRARDPISNFSQDISCVATQSHRPHGQDCPQQKHLVVP